MKKVCRFAIFNYEESDKRLIDELAEYLDTQAQKIFDFFEVEAHKEKIHINIIPTKKEFDKIYLSTWKSEAEDWAVGFYYNKQITYLSINDYNNTSHAFKEEEYPSAVVYFKKTIVHEFVHYVNDLFKIKNNCSYTEKYLSEGIATLLSGQKEGLDLPFNFTLEHIMPQKDMNKSCYNGWYLVTKYLIENYEKNFVFELFKSNRKSREFLQSELYSKAKQHYTYKEKDF